MCGIIYYVYKNFTIRFYCINKNPALDGKGHLALSLQFQMVKNSASQLRRDWSCKRSTYVHVSTVKAQTHAKGL